ncbi:MAG: penicillin-binding protein [Candidatus Liptonbacteria bacterium]|nr:penicillin-binding protein [Candidatus Liptonbacteria bacterium]
MAAATAFALIGAAILLRGLPSVEDIGSHTVAQSTKIYDRTGEVLLYEAYGEEKRTVVPFDDITAFLKEATIAVEDNNFYTHPAIDWRATLRAAFVDIIYGKRIGGSTITQQLAKNMFLTPEKTLLRKLRELIVAFRLEGHYTKDEILNLYLNQIPYGGNAYGVEAASQTYFNTSVGDVSLAEAAVLAALPQSPSYYSPWGTHQDELIARQRFILKRMEELGYIDEEQRTAAEDAPLSFAPRPIAMIRAPHFVMAVQERLIDTYGEDALRQSGLRVITTLDWELQQEAEAAVLRGAERNTELYNGHNAALVVQEARTGQVLALAGSKDYFAPPEPEDCEPGVTCKFEGNFNVAVQGLRQPGSAMKPFAYVTAFRDGYTPDTVLFDVPTEFAAANPACPPVVDFSNEDPECFHPQNFDHVFRGPVNMRSALAQSINIPAVKTLYLAGIDDTLKTAHDFGITTLNERGRYGLSLVLGGGEVKLADLVGAYAVFAQSGVRHPQSMILQVTDSSGATLEQYVDYPRRVMDAQYADMINDVLSDLSARASLFQNSASLTTFPGREIALKTGTTNDYKDAWAIGYTPSLVVGVWAGNNDATAMQKSGSSILAAVPIWHDFTGRALGGRAVEAFPRPDPVITDKPILNGDYLAGMQIHSILYWVDKRDPRGPVPVEPQGDSQFLNWEEGVLAWAREHLPDFALYNQGGAASAGWRTAGTGSAGSARVTFQSPVNGDFISDRVSIRAVIESPLTITRIETLFNDKRVDQRAGSFGTRASYDFAFLPLDIGLQNTVTIRVWDIANAQSEARVIVYK